MIDIDEIFKQEQASDIIMSLKQRSTFEHKWEDLVKDYDPEKHKIVNDHQGRKDKIHSDGTKDEAARIPIGLEKLLTQRMASFTFAIPVERKYVYDDANDSQKKIAKVIEKIYQVAHIDSENMLRANEYYASCEILSVWYTKKGEHNLYGFPCQFKLKCKTFSPMDGTKLYPLIDDKGEMHAVSFEYRRKVDTTWVTYFETFTANKHYVWKSSENSEWKEVSADDDVQIQKIPAIYLYRKHPVWYGLTKLREDLEYTISRNSDILAYNSAPVLKVAGTIVGDEMKGETRRVYRVTEGGDVSYVTWSQSIAALQNHVDTLMNLFFMQAQMPDISFANMKSLGNIGYDARKTLFADAHLKINEESGAWLEFLERENNVVKAFLKSLNLDYKEEDVDAVMIKNVITPYIQEDQKYKIEMWMKANGNNPLVSPQESIQYAGLSPDPEKTLAQIYSYQMTMEAATNPPEEQIEENE